MILIEKQGQVVRIVNLSLKPAPPKPSKRGSVTEFSRKSRRRMIDLQSRLDLTDRRIVFMTLTFHYTHSVGYTKACFKRFLSYVRYHYPQASAMWRLEFQKRGAPHYHLIFFDLPFWEFKALRKTWMDCTHEDNSGVRVNLLTSARQAMFYVSKYVAKIPELNCSTLFINAPYQQNVEEKWRGRMWGILNKECLPMAERITGVIVDEEIANYFWWFAGASLRSKDGTLRSTSRLYTDEAQRIFDFALSLGGFIADDVYHGMLKDKALHPTVRTKASYFFAGFNTHH